MRFIFGNFGETAISTNISAGATTLRLDDTSFLPIPDAEGEGFTAVILDGSRRPEIVWCSAVDVATNTVTVLRGQEDTVAREWQRGSAFVHTLTARSITYFMTGGSIEWFEFYEGLLAALDARVDALEAWKLTVDDFVNGVPGLIEAGIGDVRSSVQVIAQAGADLESAWATYQVIVNAQVGAANATATSALNAVATLNSAVATQFDQVTASIEGVAAQVTSEIQARADQYGALATAQTNLAATVGTVSASVTSEATARAAADSALASQITSLTAPGGAVTVIAEAVSTLDDTVDGIVTNFSGKYLVNITGTGGNARFASFGLYGGGTEYSVARFAVDKFEVWGGNDLPSSSYPVFAIDTVDEVIYMTNVKIRNAVIEQAAIQTLSVAGYAIHASHTAVLTNQVNVAAGSSAVAWEGSVPTFGGETFCDFQVFIGTQIIPKGSLTGNHNAVQVTLERVTPGGILIASFIIQQATVLPFQDPGGAEYAIVPGGMLSMPLKDSGVVGTPYYRITLHSENNIPFGFNYRYVSWQEQKTSKTNNPP